MKKYCVWMLSLAVLANAMASPVYAEETPTFVVENGALVIPDGMTEEEATIYYQQYLQYLYENGDANCITPGNIVIEPDASTLLSVSYSMAVPFTSVTADLLLPDGIVPDVSAMHETTVSASADRGDLNGNGVLDLSDIRLAQDEYNHNQMMNSILGTNRMQADMNEDGNFDSQDVFMMYEQYCSDMLAANTFYVYGGNTGFVAYDSENGKIVFLSLPSSTSSILIRCPILANNANFVRGEVTLQNVHSEYFTTDQFPVGFTEDAVDLSAYELIGEQVPTVAKKGIISASGYGDINTDSKMTISDAIMLSRYVAEDTTVPITDAGIAVADLNEDGNVNADDTTVLLKMLAGLAE